MKKDYNIMAEPLTAEELKMFELPIVNELKQARRECYAEGDIKNAKIYTQLINDYVADIIQ